MNHDMNHGMNRSDLRNHHNHHNLTTIGGIFNTSKKI
jgi:hypothetical protein